MCLRFSGVCVGGGGGNSCCIPIAVQDFSISIHTGFQFYSLAECPKETRGMCELEKERDGSWMAIPVIYVCMLILLILVIIIFFNQLKDL